MINDRLPCYTGEEAKHYPSGDIHLNLKIKGKKQNYKSKAEKDSFLTFALYFCLLHFYLCVNSLLLSSGLSFSGLNVMPDSAPGKGATGSVSKKSPFAIQFFRMLAISTALK